MDIDYFWNNVYRFRQSRGRILRDPIKQLVTITKSSNFKVRFSQSTANFSSWRWCCYQFSKQFDLCQSARSTACSLPTHGVDYVMDFETYHHRAKSRPPILYRNQVFFNWTINIHIFISKQTRWSSGAFNRSWVCVAVFLLHQSIRMFLVEWFFLFWWANSHSTKLHHQIDSIPYLTQN